MVVPPLLCRKLRGSKCSRREASSFTAHREQARLSSRERSLTAARSVRSASPLHEKGADVVSKWVGEAEKQLRLLFEQAKRHQPSILRRDRRPRTCRRSSKQDQVHASIVATLLALMDGLDARGQHHRRDERIDAIDPALRRPGRFDRELRFALPNRIAREKIFPYARVEPGAV